MLIPPSVLMIVWAVLTELSLGKLFLAGVLPGLLLTACFCAYVVGTALINPAVVGEGGAKPVGRAPLGAAVTVGIADEEPIGPLLLSTGLVLLLIAGVLGGIWFGFFTPTEGAGVGAVGALILAVARGISPREVWEVILNVGRTTGPLLLLLFCAQLYSRVLSMTGFTEMAKTFLLATGAGTWGILAVMLLIWIVLGCLIDSISIILLTVPIFHPIAVQLGIDPLAFAIIGILAVETGLLTPPFGLLVFTVKAAVPDRDVQLGEIFSGSIPYWFILVGVIVMIATFPQIATFLPSL
jgi:tripartite ATP-independent transporter DctM subunit